MDQNTSDQWPTLIHSCSHPKILSPKLAEPIFERSVENTKTGNMKIDIILNMNWAFHLFSIHQFQGIAFDCLLLACAYGRVVLDMVEKVMIKEVIKIWRISMPVSLIS